MACKSDITNKVKNFLKSGIFHIFGNTALSLILYGFETLMEMEVNCPCDQNLKPYYIVVTFVCPVVVLLIIGFMLHCSSLKKYCKHNKLSHSTVLSVFSILTPAVVWIALLFLDGDYYACSKLIGKNETECGSKCNENPRATQAHHCMISQFIGGVLLVLFLLVWCLTHCPPCQDKDQNIEYKVEYENMCEKETANLMRGKLEDKACKVAENNCKIAMSMTFPDDTPSPQQRPAPNH
ncbi:uncharacterized protein LOC125446605 isoform X2 [Stegostoma tigrinum]|uniref:uncharacterized protein LOC125446605 isoform X2 n=1 Tax=Stegostoma tigrinum TaxID=3053191 RepID=UPI00202AE6BC|nr:uncharacterized protein LOC125446605 isoform X2 [Stegostoma tigrinum]